MHEVGIANSILEAVRTEAAPHAPARATKVGVKIGEMAGIDANSLAFCFEALVKGSDLEPLELEAVVVVVVEPPVLVLLLLEPFEPLQPTSAAAAIREASAETRIAIPSEKWSARP